MNRNDDHNVKDNVSEIVGNTPIVRLARLEDHFSLEVDLYAKLEYMNPGGSVKDRVGLEMLEGAINEGKIEEGGVIVEPTSGNTGMGLAIAANLQNIFTVFTMPDKMSQEKELLLEAMGAEVVRTPTEVKPEDPLSYYSAAEVLKKLFWELEEVERSDIDEIVERVRRLYREEKKEKLEEILSRDVEPSPKAYLPNQYENKYNPLAHENTTGPEIMDQIGDGLDYFFAGVGTGGTISGVSRYLKDKISLKVIGIDPKGSIISKVKKGKSEEEVKDEAESYLTEGIGEDLIPETLDLDLIDEIVKSEDQKSFSMARFLAREESIFAGGSAGSAVYGAIKYIKDNDIREGKALVLIPDTGRNYLTRVFDDEWMKKHGLMINDEEVLEVIK